MASKTVRIPNISCGHCVMTIEREVGELEGVSSVKAEQESQMVTVEWNEPPTNWGNIQALLEEINYPPENWTDEGRITKDELMLRQSSFVLRPPSFDLVTFRCLYG